MVMRQAGRRHHIVITVPLEYNYCRQVLCGVRQAAAAQPGLVLHERNYDDLLRGYATVQGTLAGVIVHAAAEDLTPPLQALGVPVVNTSNRVAMPAFPRVGVDEAAIGRVAAEHLLALGLKSLAVFTRSHPVYAEQRQQAFIRTVTGKGMTVHEYRRHKDHTRAEWDPSATDSHIARWLRGLPKPIGIFATTDKGAMLLCDLCRYLGIRVPDEVAVVGCDNDEFVCQSCTPSLSSVATPGEQVGREAVRLLSRLIAGCPAPERPVLLPPVTLVARGSSAVRACDDPEVRTALAFIRAHATEGITTRDVLDVVPICRRVLERRFQFLLGHSPLEEIRHARLQCARRLLVETDLPVAQIASACGFSSPQYLARVFQADTGMTPRAYRSRYSLLQA